MIVFLNEVSNLILTICPSLNSYLHQSKLHTHFFIFDTSFNNMLCSNLCLEFLSFLQLSLSFAFCTFNSSFSFMLGSFLLSFFLFLLLFNFFLEYSSLFFSPLFLPLVFFCRSFSLIILKDSALVRTLQARQGAAIIFFSGACALGMLRYCEIGDLEGVVRTG